MSDKNRVGRYTELKKIKQFAGFNVKINLIFNEKKFVAN